MVEHSKYMLCSYPNAVQIEYNQIKPDIRSKALSFYGCLCTADRHNGPFIMQ